MRIRAEALPMSAQIGSVVEPAEVVSPAMNLDT
jgi:hypothetical protein